MKQQTVCDVADQVLGVGDALCGKMQTSYALIRLASTVLSHAVPFQARVARSAAQGSGRLQLTACCCLGWESAGELDSGSRDSPVIPVYQTGPENLAWLPAYCIMQTRSQALQDSSLWPHLYLFLMCLRVARNPLSLVEGN